MNGRAPVRTRPFGSSDRSRPLNQSSEARGLAGNWSRSESIPHLTGRATLEGTRAPSYPRGAGSSSAPTRCSSRRECRSPTGRSFSGRTCVLMGPSLTNSPAASSALLWPRASINSSRCVSDCSRAPASGLSGRRANCSMMGRVTDGASRASPPPSSCSSSGARACDMPGASCSTSDIDLQPSASIARSGSTRTASDRREVADVPQPAYRTNPRRGQLPKVTPAHRRRPERFFLRRRSAGGPKDGGSARSSPRSCLKRSASPPRPPAAACASCAAWRR
jgi:hypothetical protein